jgi:DNA-binding transcriptional LysR family regulator
MIDSIEELKIFSTIFELKSIRMAADTHNLTAAAVSKRLIALENGVLGIFPSKKT